MEESTIALVSCGKRKSDSPCCAKDMYNSARFQGFKTILETFDLPWYIMSAKYGLLSPDDEISPYDMCLTNCTAEYRKKWAESILKKLQNYPTATAFSVMANNDYSRDIVPLLEKAGFVVEAPFLGREEEYVAQYIENAAHVEDVKKLYDCLKRLSDNTGGIRMFRECCGKMYWPQRGVYFIVDFNEKSTFADDFPRIVRVGTHAVSRGSRSTLWHRLKTHKGTDEGGGNHRGSIFRLHVGNAIIKKQGLVCDTWGKGEHADREVREKEKHIEHLVSDYISRLGVVVLDIDDLPSSTSDRATVERNAIALLSSINSSFNFSTTRWLGNYSPRDEIVESCLWNINYISSGYDTGFMPKFEHYIDDTIKNYKLNN